MEEGTKVYRGYTSDSGGTGGFFSYVMQGEVVVLPGGLRMVRMPHGDAMYAMTPDWVSSKVEANRSIHAAMVRYIGKWQAEADELAAQILHEELTTDEVQNGVA